MHTSVSARPPWLQDAFALQMSWSAMELVDLGRRTKPSAACSRQVAAACASFVPSTCCACGAGCALSLQTVVLSICEMVLTCFMRSTTRGKIHVVHLLAASWKAFQMFRAEVTMWFCIKVGTMWKDSCDHLLISNSSCPLKCNSHHMLTRSKHVLIAKRRVYVYVLHTYFPNSSWTWVFLRPYIMCLFWEHYKCNFKCKMHLNMHLKLYLTLAKYIFKYYLYLICIWMRTWMCTQLCLNPISSAMCTWLCTWSCTWQCLNTCPSSTWTWAVAIAIRYVI